MSSSSAPERAPLHGTVIPDPIHGEHREGCTGARPDWCMTCAARRDYGEGWEARIVAAQRWGRPARYTLAVGARVHVIGWDDERASFILPGTSLRVAVRRDAVEPIR